MTPHDIKKIQRELSLLKMKEVITINDKYRIQKLQQQIDSDETIYKK